MAPEGYCVAPNPVRIQADLLVSTCEEGVGAEGRSQPVQRFAKLGARMELVLLWPEERDDLVAAPESIGRREREVGKERESFRLAQHGSAGEVAGQREFCVTKNSQFSVRLFANHPNATARVRSRYGPGTRAR